MQENMDAEGLNDYWGKEESQTSYKILIVSDSLLR